MVGKLELMLSAVAAITLAMTGVAPLRAQDVSTNVGRRYHVLIPPFQPMQGADDRFGRDAAEKLRDLVNTLATNAPVEEKDLKNALKRFHLKMRDLDCVRTRQLAARMHAEVALCSDYRDEGGNTELVQATFYDVASGEAFKVEPKRFGEKDANAAARYVFDAFHTYVDQIRAAQFCGSYAQSRDWANAMENCDRAIRLNPDAIGARYTRADVLFRQDKYDDAMAELERILAREPNHGNALSLAGYISVKLGRDEQARQYYQRYLDLNPGDATVRMKIAYDLAKAGDPEGAMQIIEVGLKVDSTNVDLLEQYAGFAFNAALKSEQAANGADSSAAATDSAKATTHYREAVGAAEKVFAARGDSTSASLLSNAIIAYDKLGESAKAVSLGARAVRAHSGEAQIWSVYADALHENGRLEQAIAVLDTVRKLDSLDTNSTLKQGSWLVQAGRLHDAVNVLQPLAAAHPESADQAANVIFADAYNNHVRKNQYDAAMPGIVAAASLPNLSADMQRQLAFWQAYAIYQSAIAEQRPQTLATAKATLPKFERARALLRHVGDYPRKVNVDPNQMANACDQYIEIQQAIIKRGGR
jgi:tetratricopeptide (TPR) repeat protein